MIEKHGPNTSDHPPDDFDVWEEATWGKKKGNLVGLGTRGDLRVMVTCTSATSSSSSTSSERVQTLQEIIRRLQEDNTQMREHVLTHMQQRELEVNAREQARERAWQQRMNDINLVLKKFTDSRPDP